MYGYRGYRGIYGIYGIFGVFLPTVMYGYVRLCTVTAVYRGIYGIYGYWPCRTIPRYFLGFYGNRGTVTVTVKYRGYGILRLP